MRLRLDIIKDFRQGGANECDETALASPFSLSFVKFLQHIFVLGARLSCMTSIPAGVAGICEAARVETEPEALGRDPDFSLVPAASPVHLLVLETVEQWRGAE